jgi:predicted porin
MKKSLLALAVASAAFVATSVSATPVYNKDGTSLDIGGRIEAMWMSGGEQAAARDDSTIRNRARLNIAGRTQLTNGIAAYGFAEWQSQNAGDSAGSGFTDRDQYVGVDFGKFGKIQAGRYEDPFQYASDVTDHFEEHGCMALVGDERNSGKLSYLWSGFGVDAGATVQFAENKYDSDVIKGLDKDTYVNVNDGFSLFAGYTTPNVVFGPISIRAAYKYIDGQRDDSNTTGNMTIFKVGELKGTSLGSLDHEKTWAAGLSWGTFKKGLYLAVDYTYDKVEFFDEDNDLTTKAFESIISYGFDSGVVLSTGYQWRKQEIDKAAKGEYTDRAGKLVQFTVAYNINPNFRVWAEANIDAGSDDYYSLTKLKNDSKDAENLFDIGARYTF